MLTPSTAKLRRLWSEGTPYVVNNAPSLEKLRGTWAQQRPRAMIAASVDRVRRFWDGRVWPAKLMIRYLGVLFVFIFVIANYFLIDFTGYEGVLSYGRKHPIKHLIVEAEARHEATLAKRSYDMYAAATRYRARRGRHPPPGFDRWVQAALHSDAVIVEDYFDRIYKDLAPFWALDTNTIRQRANSSPWVVRVRNGTAIGDGDVTDKVPWLQLWTSLVEEFAEFMPDVDMPINYMDEPRLLVPFDDISKMVEKEQSERVLTRPENVTTAYKGLSDLDTNRTESYEPQWYGPDNAYWDLAVKTCGPETPAYGVPAMTDYSQRPQFPRQEPEYAFEGFIRNWTAAMDPCLQPHLRQLHGTFIEPISLSTSQELIPLFGGSKLPMNNEILIPGAMYLTSDTFYSGGEDHGPPWNDKKDGIVWRGDGNGGRPKPESWSHFQRHRLVDMLNATSVALAESWTSAALTFDLPSRSIYKSFRLRRGQLAKWLRKYANAGFVHLCPPGECDWIFPFYEEVEGMPMAEQYQYKFLPDVDGNSFSARFRGFLRSTSVPIKSTIYAEWHDDRLVPWVHFIPMDNTFRDLYSLLEFFGDGSGNGNFAAALIALRGMQWSEQVLRREDMKLYVWRLLLEWARVCDENRHTLGWVQDLDVGLNMDA